MDKASKDPPPEPSKVVQSYSMFIPAGEDGSKTEHIEESKSGRQNGIPASLEPNGSNVSKSNTSLTVMARRLDSLYKPNVTHAGIETGNSSRSISSTFISNFDSNRLEKLVNQRKSLIDRTDRIRLSRWKNLPRSPSLSQSGSFLMHEAFPISRKELGSTLSADDRIEETVNRKSAIGVDQERIIPHSSIPMVERDRHLENNKTVSLTAMAQRIRKQSDHLRSSSNSIQRHNNDESSISCNFRSNNMNEINPTFSLNADRSALTALACLSEKYKGALGETCTFSGTASFEEKKSSTSTDEIQFVRKELCDSGDNEGECQDSSADFNERKVQKSSEPNNFGYGSSPQCQDDNIFLTPNAKDDNFNTLNDNNVDGPVNSYLLQLQTLMGRSVSSSRETANEYVPETNMIVKEDEKSIVEIDHNTRSEGSLISSLSSLDGDNDRNKIQTGQISKSKKYADKRESHRSRLKFIMFCLIVIFIVDPTKRKAIEISSSHLCEQGQKAIVKVLENEYIVRWKEEIAVIITQNQPLINTYVKHYNKMASLTLNLINSQLNCAVMSLSTVKDSWGGPIIGRWRGNLYDKIARYDSLMNAFGWIHLKYSHFETFIEKKRKSLMFANFLLLSLSRFHEDERTTETKNFHFHAGTGVADISQELEGQLRHENNLMKSFDLAQDKSKLEEETYLPLCPISDVDGNYEVCIKENVESIVEFEGEKTISVMGPVLKTGLVRKDSVLSRIVSLVKSELCSKDFKRSSTVYRTILAWKLKHVKHSQTDFKIISCSDKKTTATLQSLMHSIKQLHDSKKNKSMSRRMQLYTNSIYSHSWKTRTPRAPFLYKSRELTNKFKAFGDEEESTIFTSRESSLQNTEVGLMEVPYTLIEREQSHDHHRQSTFIFHRQSISKLRKDDNIPFNDMNIMKFEEEHLDDFMEISIMEAVGMFFNDLKEKRRARKIQRIYPSTRQI